MVLVLLTGGAGRLSVYGTGVAVTGGAGRLSVYGAGVVDRWC